MPELDVTYYAGEWSDRERRDVREAVEAAGFGVIEERGAMAAYTTSMGVQKGAGFFVTPQLLIDAIEVLKLAAEISVIAVPLTAALLDIYGRFRGKKDFGSVQALTETRIYIVPFDAGDAGVDAINAIVSDLTDGAPQRLGDMTWRDGRWQTVEELHGIVPTTPKAPGRAGGHKRRDGTRVRKGRKGRRGQTR
jgi:hypothetical protein